MIAPSPQRKAAQTTSPGGKAPSSAKPKNMRPKIDAMEKTRNPVVAAKQTSVVKETVVTNVTKYLKSVWGEAKRVTWPSQTEVKRGTAVVIVAVVLISIYLFIVDKGLGFIFNFFRNIFHH